MKQFKKNANINIELDINGEKHNLGKLVTCICSYCPVLKKNIFSFKCIRTGKSFTDTDKLSKHISEMLIKTKKITLQ